MIRRALAPSVLLAVLAAVTARAEEPLRAAVGPFSPPAKAGFRVGMAKVDMTPDLSQIAVSLNGYGDRDDALATAVLDPVYARALVVVDAHGGLAAIVAADLCYVTTELRDLALAELGEDGFDGRNFLLAATHTHSSFSGYDGSRVAKLFMGEFHEEVLIRTAHAIARAVRDAKAQARPAVMSVARAWLSGFNRSRLDPSFDHARGRSLAASADPRFALNQRAVLVRFQAEDGTNIGAVTQFSAHPTVLSPKNLAISADYPGVLCRRLEGALGPGSVALFLNGSLGDLAPTPDWAESGDIEVKRMEAYGNGLADAFLGMMPALVPTDDTRLRANSVRLPFENLVVNVFGGVTLPGFLTGLVTTRDELTVQAMALGRLVLLAIPGEATTRAGTQLETVCENGDECIVVAPANAYVGYIVTRDEYELDRYEADSCFFGPDAAAWARSAIETAYRGLQ
ncbi:MAG: neutral/alkaline non-lysosomal ceramidase N-terminal domain-containing protein [bacterium]